MAVWHQTPSLVGGWVVLAKREIGHRPEVDTCHTGPAPAAGGARATRAGVQRGWWPSHARQERRDGTSTRRGSARRIPQSTPLRAGPSPRRPNSRAHAPKESRDPRSGARAWAPAWAPHNMSTWTITLSRIHRTRIAGAQSQVSRGLRDRCAASAHQHEPRRHIDHASITRDLIRMGSLEQLAAGRRMCVVRAP